jgi:dynein heavy chain
LIGNPGAAKSTIWKILEKTNCITPLDENNPDGPKNETISAIVDPKAVTNDELYGCMNPKTREWKDGILSVIMRDMNKCTHPFKEEHTQKWIVLDGDVDPEWIETMNTVMDDNKVLTLVSQERIPLTPSMRLLLEISHLKNATPATVSRGGVLFINDSDVGWKAYFDSWLSKYKAKDEIAFNQFTLAQSTYLAESFLDVLKSWSHITPVCDMGQVCSLTCIIDNLYQTLHTNKAQNDMMKRYKEENNEEKIKEIYEAFFLFAGMWAYGASLDEDKLSFNGQWKGMAKTVKFPDINGTFCWDFFFDPIEHCWVNWNERTDAFDKQYEGLFQNLVVPTAETARQKYLLNMHVAARKGMLFVGSAGTGKTTIIKDYFTTLDKEYTLSEAINFNNYTDSKAL